MGFPSECTAWFEFAGAGTCVRTVSVVPLVVSNGLQIRGWRSKGQCHVRGERGLLLACGGGAVDDGLAGRGLPSVENGFMQVWFGARGRRWLCFRLHCVALTTGCGRADVFSGVLLRASMLVVLFEARRLSCALLLGGSLISPPCCSLSRGCTRRTPCAECCCVSTSPVGDRRHRLWSPPAGPTIVGRDPPPSLASAGPPPLPVCAVVAPPPLLAHALSLSPFSLLAGGQWWPAPSPATGGLRRRLPEASRRWGLASPPPPPVSEIGLQRGDGMGAGALRQSAARLAHYASRCPSAHYVGRWPRSPLGAMCQQIPS
ncbi:hypothetical protein Taro_045822 [Colocasia esculenta]|uniref:Uncharacterized protein n=1 Tax=Colocasia esculenta TaxID=4460 RepID=A0A843WQJ1_COLES|nr:hypothetical protein [Colocasia esculenta]